MAQPSTAMQLWVHRLAYSMKLQNSPGTAFQEFFATVMERAHGPDYVRIRPFGSLGDKGCDGYLRSLGRVYQCFGKLGDSAVTVSTLVSKLGDDYDLAKRELRDLMKSWCFVHNLSDGLPVDALLKLKALQTANPQHGFSTMSPGALWEVIKDLSEADLLDLLGPAATAEDSRALRLELVRELVDELCERVSSHVAPAASIKPVPANKLEFNKLPPHWVGLIKAGSQNAPFVQQYFDRHPDPEAGERVAKLFAGRYANAKMDGRSPERIMDHLYELITGVGSVPVDRQVAAYALLAYLFDACDIFEEEPSKVAL
jgi:hypothetical protein